MSRGSSEISAWFCTVLFCENVWWNYKTWKAWIVKHQIAADLQQRYSWTPTLPFVGPHFCPLSWKAPFAPIPWGGAHCTELAAVHHEEDRVAVLVQFLCLLFHNPCSDLVHCSCRRFPLYPHWCVANVCFTTISLALCATRGLSNFTPTYIRWLADCLCRLLPCLQCTTDQLACWLAGDQLIGCALQRRYCSKHAVTNHFTIHGSERVWRGLTLYRYCRTGSLQNLILHSLNGHFWNNLGGF